MTTYICPKCGKTISVRSATATVTCQASLRCAKGTLMRPQGATQ